jgi:hypothetical protein
LAIDPEESRRNMMLAGPAGSVKNCSSPDAGPRVVLPSDALTLKQSGAVPSAW